MYPFTNIFYTGAAESTVDVVDDMSALSDIYPGPGWPSAYPTIQGTIYVPRKANTPQREPRGQLSAGAFSPGDPPEDLFAELACELQGRRRDVAPAPPWTEDDELCRRIDADRVVEAEHPHGVTEEFPVVVDPFKELPIIKHMRHFSLLAPGRGALLRKAPLASPAWRHSRPFPPRGTSRNRRPWHWRSSR